ncbi:accessory Sec system glycosyltransferase Asp1 [Weissella viridescens]
MVLIMPNFNTQTEHPELDTGIAVAKVFQANQVETELVFAHEFPNLRTKLKQAQVPFFPWWHVFDAIQAVPFKMGVPMVLKDVPLEPGVEPFMDVNDAYYYREGRLVKHVHLLERYIVQFITYYDENGERITDYYDDRGFVTFRAWLNSAGKLEKKSWLTPAGQPVLTALADQKVIVEPKHQKRFKSAVYHNIDEVVQEKIREHIQMLETKPAMILEENDVHLHEVLDNLAPELQKAIILMADENHQQDAMALPHDDLELVFTSDAARNAYFGTSEPTSNSHVISPYPARLELGASNEMANMNIVLQLADGLSPNDKTTLAQTLAQMLIADENKVMYACIDGLSPDQVTFHLRVVEAFTKEIGITYNDADYKIFESTMERSMMSSEADVMDYLDQQYEKEDREPISDEKQAQIIAAYQLRQRFVVLDTPSMEKQLGLIKQARVFVDLRRVPDAQLQAQALSTGLPQITVGANTFVTQGVNGFVLADPMELPQALTYFTDDLKHWNEALVENVRQVEQHSEFNLITAWGGLMNYGH